MMWIVNHGRKICRICYFAAAADALADADAPFAGVPSSWIVPDVRGPSARAQWDPENGNGAVAWARMVSLPSSSPFSSSPFERRGGVAALVRGAISEL